MTLTNSLFWADKERLQSDKSFRASSIRFGHVLLCKTFCGNARLIESPNDTPSNCDSTLRICPPPDNGDNACIDCSRRIQEWTVFDRKRVLPEYIIFYMYDSLHFPSNPFLDAVGSVFKNDRSAPLFKTMDNVVSNYVLESDSELVAGDPNFAFKE